jgi:hypothetical protein
MQNVEIAQRLREVTDFVKEQGPMSIASVHIDSLSKCWNDCKHRHGQ